MANKTFERMIKLGEWLESYLDPEAKAWTYKKLAHAFIDLYDVDFGITKDEITFKIIDLIEAQELGIKNYYHTGHIGENASLARSISNKEDPLKILDLIEKIGTEQYNNNHDNMELFINSIRYKSIDVYKYREYLQQALKMISESQLNWSETIINLNKKQAYVSKGDPNTGEVFEHIEPEQKPQTVFFLSEDYGLLRDSIVLDRHKNEIVIRKQFDIDGHFFPRGYVESEPNCERSSNFPWRIAASRVFFDFCFLGGQDYCLFCEHCGRFTVIKRKGRKKFCSDLCRSNNRFKK